MDIVTDFIFLIIMVLLVIYFYNINERRNGE